MIDVASDRRVSRRFHPELTGGENVHLSGSILEMRRRGIQAKFDRIVEFSGVGGFIETPVTWYSSGMYVRLDPGERRHHRVHRFFSGFLRERCGCLRRR
jgi:ABC-type polysaccharide/polyol phosphate transport system ATPase subunit